MDVDEQFELISGYVDTYLTDCDEETKEKFESICATILQNADEGATGAEDTLSQLQDAFGVIQQGMLDDTQENLRK